MTAAEHEQWVRQNYRPWYVAASPAASGGEYSGAVEVYAEREFNFRCAGDTSDHWMTESSSDGYRLVKPPGRSARFFGATFERRIEKAMEKVARTAALLNGRVSREFELRRRAERAMLRAQPMGARR